MAIEMHWRPLGLSSRLWRAALLTALMGGLSGLGITAGFASDASLEHARQETPATWQGPSTPAKAPKGVKVGIVSCAAAFHGCQAPADAASEAAQKIGWKVTMYDGGGTQEKWNAAILDAVSAGSDIILTTSIDPRFIQLALDAAKKANIPVISAGQGTDTPNPVFKNDPGSLSQLLDVGPDYVELGRRLGEWIVADSEGKANVVVYTDDEYVSVVEVKDGVVESLKHCPDCKVSEIQKITGSQVPTMAGPMVVGYLQTHPDVNYVWAPYDPAAVFMVNAIVQAGFGDKVKVGSTVGAAQNLDFIRQGRSQAVDGAIENSYMGYAMVDQAIRVLNKQPVIEPHGEGTPFHVLDKTSLPDVGSDWQTKSDYKERFLKLWQ